MEEYKSDIINPIVFGVEDSPVIKEDVAKAMSEVNADWDALRKKDIIGSEMQDSDITIFKRPRGGCKSCYGRGFLGFYSKDSKKMPLEPALCSCMTNTLSIRGEMPDPKDRMSYEEYRDMLAKARRVYNLKEPENEQDDQLDAVSVQSDVQENA